MFRNRQPKIVIIGAASSSFSGILADLVSCRELDGAELALVDIDEESLGTMTSLGQRMVKEWKRKTRIVSATDRRKVLEGADFVLTLIAVGGITTWRQDEELPKKHGFFGCCCDSNGPGGLFRGLRLIPPLIEVCHDIEKMCPDAWVINYSNPMTGVCRALNKATNVKVVGLCTSGFLPRHVAKLFEVDPDRVDVVSAGVNHCMWALKVMVDGKDVTEEHKQLMRDKHSTDYNRSTVELMDILGVCPMPAANHIAEYFPYFYGPGDDSRDDGRYPYRTEQDFDKRLERINEGRAELKRQADGTDPLGAEAEESASEAIRMLISVWNNHRTRHYANVPNRGIVPNLPPEAVLEVPVIADASGIRPTHIGPLPQSIVGFNQSRSAFFELLADAAIQKSRRIALQCLLADTNTTSFVNAKAGIAEMFEVQSEYLPGFA